MSTAYAVSIALKPCSRRAACAGHAAEVHVEPQHADLRERQVVRVRLHEHRGVGGVPVEQQLQRAVAGALLLHDGLQLHVAGELHARRPAAS